MESKVPDKPDFSIYPDETTSPSQLQEVTLENDGTFSGSIGLRSPNGPLRGRSVKEFEEQLTTLKKENFNLKLRIYFLEERMGTNFNLDKENAVKQNIELLVEVESLRKDIQEKQDLLCQAVKAMELEEEEHKKDSETKSKQLCELQKQLDDLQQKYESLEEEMTTRQQLDDQRELFVQAFDIPDVQNSEIVKNLNSKVENLEMQLLKEKENNREITQLLAISESKSKGFSFTENEIKLRDERINSLTAELEEKNRALTGYNYRLTALETELSEKVNELQTKAIELKHKESEFNSRIIELEEVKQLLAETKNLYEAEQRKVEKHKLSVLQRNNKIVELESQAEKQKAKVMNLEAILEQAQTEVKKKTDELQSLRSPIRRQKSTITDVDSFLVSSSTTNTEGIHKKTSVTSPLKSTSNSSASTMSPSKTRTRGSLVDDERALVLYQKKGEKLNDSDKSLEMLEQNLEKSKKHIMKLEKDQVRACKIIQSMLETRKEHLKQIGDLELQLQTKEKEVTELHDKVKKPVGNEEATKKLQTKISELNLTATTNPPTDSENSLTYKTEEARQLLEQYKELTSELDKQKQILITTLKEKDNQIQKLQEQYNLLFDDMKVKENRIIDLEFELIAHNQECRDSSLTEKKDIGTEKSSFWLQEIEEKDKEIERLEGELRKRTCDLQSVVNNELWEKNREIEKLQNRFGSITESKDSEIMKLRNEISGKDLQLQVLKEKISELGIHISSNMLTSSLKNLSACDDTKSLQEQLKSLLEERKYLENQIHELKVKLRQTPESDHGSKLQQLQRECKDLQEELEKSEKLRHETNEVCHILSTRLEELAHFLDSLLKQKSVLGFLGNKQNSRLRQFVDQTLDISRTLTVSMTLNPDQSLLQLSNLSTLLNSSRNANISISDLLPFEDENNSILSIVPGNVTLTYQSHLSRATDPSPDNLVTEQGHIINVLREQIENLKKEIDLRDIELGKKLVQSDKEFVDAIMDMSEKDNCNQTPVSSPQRMHANLMDDKTKITTSATLKYRSENQSESESWSEPDRNVSFARMGLLSESLKPSGSSATRHNRSLPISAESTEEEQINLKPKKSILLESKQAIANLTKQVSELENKLKEKEKQLLAVEVAYYESETLLKKERNRLEDARKLTEELQIKYKEMEQRMFSTESTKSEAEKKLENLLNTIEELDRSKKNLEMMMDSKDKDLQNKLNVLEREKDDALKSAKATEEKLKQIEEAAQSMIEDTKKQIKNAEEKMAEMEIEKEKLAEVIREDERNKYNKRVAALEEECQTKINAMKQKTEEQIQKLTEAANMLQQKYEKEYVKRAEVEKLKKTIQDLELVRHNYQLTEVKMSEMKEYEDELKNRLVELEREHRDEINTLRKELDRATLQYSEAVLEKTKLINEKTSLEKQIKEFSSKEADFVKQVTEFQQDFTTMKDNFQRRVAHLENQKTALETRITELELANAEARSKLVKVQCGQTGDQIYSSSAPTHPSRLMDALLQKSLHHIMPYSRQTSDNSGYTSEEPNEDPNGNARHNANSSPDLGIESDHGRLSSLEAHLNVARPFLQTLELTESMNNLLEEANNIESVCDNVQCTMKTKQIINENAELRRRLSKTKHALEETVIQLSLANRKKKEVEKTICKQIHKTSQVLRKAKANLDSGSESDILKK